MLKSVIFFGLLASWLFAQQELGPAHTYTAGGAVIDIAIGDTKLYAGTDQGSVEVFDTQTKKKIQEIKLPMIKDFMGESKMPKIFSVDRSEDGQKILILGEGEGGNRNLYLHEGGKLAKLISSKEGYLIKKAKFASNKTVLFALISNEIFLYDLASRKIVYTKSISPSSFSDFAFSEDKKLIALSCESGEIFIIEVATGKVVQKLKGGNLDNVYKVDFKKRTVIGAGQDRKVSVYTLPSGSFYTIPAEFLVYAAALSPTAAQGAYAVNEKNHIAIFNTATKTITHLLKGQGSTLNTILFVSEDRLFSSSDDRNILEWRLK